MTCEAQRQQDEMFCSRCDMRWDFHGDPVQCGKERERTGHLPDTEEVKAFRELTERILGDLDG